RDAKTHVEQRKAKRNEASQQIGELKRQGKDTSGIMAEVAKHAEEIHSADHNIHQMEELFNFELSKLPNIPMDDIKVAESPQDNVIIKSFGEKKVFDFSFK